MVDYTHSTVQHSNRIMFRRSYSLNLIIRIQAIYLDEGVIKSKAVAIRPRPVETRTRSSSIAFVGVYGEDDPGFDGRRLETADGKFNVWGNWGLTKTADLTPQIDKIMI